MRIEEYIKTYAITFKIEYRPIKSLYKIYCIPIAELQFMFVQALFLYIEKRIIRIIGNPVMDDNCKMVAKFRAITL